MKIDDDHHEAHGAMIHRGLVEQRVINHHGNQAEALEMARGALEYIANWKNLGPEGSNDFEMAYHASSTLTRIDSILTQMKPFP